MYRWYARASKCYVYLQDVSAARKRDGDGKLLCNWEAAFQKSRWFTRGWTLQELLAPSIVEFWSSDGHLLGTKETLKSKISTMTGIPHRALSGVSPKEFTMNERLRWAAGRETKKSEDKAYCLFGIFDIFLPLIYGEGENAFARLRREIETRKATCSLSGPFHNNGGDLPASAEETAQSQAQRRQELLASLSFDYIEARHSTIKDAQRTTCEWLLGHPDYVAWNSRDKRPRNQEILWIAGKPGAGKSTIMKFALARSRKDQLKDDIILSFFFNARGEDLEKTVVGMYRALLFQLLNKAPDLQSILDDVDMSIASHTSPNQSFVWTCNVLQDRLRVAIESLGPRRLRCFIDALDECDEQEVRDMVDFFEDLGEVIGGDDSLLHICFASRHYPTVKINGGWRLVLEDQAGHSEDLAKYIRRHLQAGKGSLITEIRSQVQEKANGVFMWAVLVVGILNKEIRAGRMFDVKRRLKELPSKLSDLFKDMIRRDRENMPDLLLCLQWILFSRRPLKREEFYFAMVAGLQHGPEHAVNWQPQLWDPDEFTDDDMKRFVLHSSKGLAELTRSTTNPTVQFIHESVRDFLLKEGGIYELWPELRENLASASHDKLKECCSRAMATDILNILPSVKALPAASTEEVRSLCQQLARMFPFLEYASQQVLWHANEAARGVPSENFLDTFPLDQWVRITNLYERHNIRRHGPGATLCYLAAEYNFTRLLEAIKSHGAWVRLPDQRYQVPAIAAFANGHKEALQVLLGDENAALSTLITRDPGFGKPSEVSRSQDLLRWNSTNSNWAFVEYLLTSHFAKGLYTDARSTERGAIMRDACKLAIHKGATRVVQLLLERGVDVDFNALREASRHGHMEIVQLLLDNGAEVNAQGGSYSNALRAASERGNIGVVQLLLDHGAHVNAQGGFLGNALRAASERGNIAVVQLLLDSGATQDGSESSQLKLPDPQKQEQASHS